MPERIADQNYSGCEPKTRLVIDFLAAHELVPRIADDGKTAPPMEGRSSSEIAKEIREEFDVHVADGMPTWVYQRCGDREHAPAFFARHRQRLAEEHLQNKWEGVAI